MAECPFYNRKIVPPDYAEITPELKPPNSVLTTFEPTSVTADPNQGCSAMLFTRDTVVPDPRSPHQEGPRVCRKCAAMVDHSSAPLPIINP